MLLNIKHEWKYAQPGHTNCHKRTTVEEEGMKSSQWWCPEYSAGCGRCPPGAHPSPLVLYHPEKQEMTQSSFTLYCGDTNWHSRYVHVDRRQQHTRKHTSISLVLKQHTAARLMLLCCPPLFTFFHQLCTCALEGRRTSAGSFLDQNGPLGGDYECPLQSCNGKLYFTV